ncbi:MAG: hypothetical protein M9911_09825 [Saprospiraceae bacterium]|nr:hypothetical protein [Saprospiraceae bacterium]
MNTANYIKIGMASFIIGIIGFMVYIWIKPCAPCPCPGPCPDRCPCQDTLKNDTTEITKGIYRAIDSIKNLPTILESKKLYDLITYQIDDGYKGVRLGKDSLENTQMRENLESTAFSEYASKVLGRSLYTLNDTLWTPIDLQAIKVAINSLQSSNLLESGSEVASNFDKILISLDKYYKVYNFISNCKEFNFDDYSISAIFPTDKVEEDIANLESYKNEIDSDPYLKNCLKLSRWLEDIPTVYYHKNLKYLDMKIKKWSNKCSLYVDLNDYLNNLHKPIYQDIRLLSNDLYHIDSKEFEMDWNLKFDQWNLEKVRAIEKCFNHN